MDAAGCEADAAAGRPNVFRAHTLLARPIHQVILAHGEPIEGDALARLEQALRWMTSGDGLLAPASNRT